LVKPEDSFLGREVFMRGEMVFWRRVSYLVLFLFSVPFSAETGVPRPPDPHSTVEPTVYPSKVGPPKRTIQPTQPGVLPIQVKVHVLSRYDLHQVEITSPLGSLKVLKTGTNFQEAMWPPGASLILKAKGNQIEVQIENSVFTADQLLIQAPINSFLTVKLGGDSNKKFEGKLSVRSSNGALFFIDELPLENYVQGVLEAEIPYGFPPEALKAQAVLIRTYALKNFDRHLKEGYNLCDLTHCQVFGGREHSYRSYEEAVKQTKGVILASNFKPVEAMYHSTCGGHTSAFHRVFGGPMIPYLMGVDDLGYCKDSPHQEWDGSIPLNILWDVLKKDMTTNPHGEIKNLKIVDGEKDGRVFTLALEGQRNFDLPVTQFMSVVGRYLGWSKVKSNWFEVEVNEGEARFKGRGLGHGVGLCQWGAKGMADAGKKFDEILFHYFPGTNLIQK
jgi:stage II sporulation protein D